MKTSGFLLCALIASPVALADTRITMTDNADEPTLSTINIKGGKVVVESDGEVMGIFDVATNSFTQVDHKNKSYMVMDKAAMDGVADQMSGMMKQFEEQMANVPPEQREAMMQMIPAEMRERLQGKKVEVKKPEISWTGKSDKVAGYKCKVATVSNTDGGEDTACIAKLSTLGVSDEDFETMNALVDMMQEIATQFGAKSEIPDTRDMGGIPIRMSTKEGGVTVLQNISNDKLDSALFEIPAGYRARSLTDGM